MKLKISRELRSYSAPRVTVVGSVAGLIELAPASRPDEVGEGEPPAWCQSAWNVAVVTRLQ